MSVFDLVPGRIIEDEVPISYGDAEDKVSSTSVAHSDADRPFGFKISDLNMCIPSPVPTSRAGLNPNFYSSLEECKDRLSTLRLRSTFPSAEESDVKEYARRGQTQIAINLIQKGYGATGDSIASVVRSILGKPADRITPTEHRFLSSLINTSDLSDPEARLSLWLYGVRQLISLRYPAASSVAADRISAEQLIDGLETSTLLKSVTSI
jgi:hypothetical protein